MDQSLALFIKAVASSTGMSLCIGRISPRPGVCKVGIGVQRNHCCWIHILPAGDLWKLISISS